ncbi:ketosynthase chain-length factor [Nocardia sp. NPDC058114]|uniref:ketosynthase chain-length factor n=1 Tax=Nocardia sp. NPDC058114 TaxID=3346346 RepID=UPI0036DA15F3
MTLVTGFGVIAPNGTGAERFWEAAVEGRGAIAPLTRFDVSGSAAQLAGEVADFDAAEHLPSRLLPQTDVSTRMALVAAEWAIDDAKVDTSAADDYQMAVVTGNACGGFEFTHREFEKLWSRGPEHVSVYESFAWFYAVNTGQISIRYGMRGPSSALVAEQAGGLDAIGHACRTVRGGTSLVVTGGVDSAFDPWGWAAHVSSGEVSTATDPLRAYLPFDVRAAGYVPGEGGAMLVVESAESARARGILKAYGEIAGYASTFDPPPGSERPSGLLRAADLALAAAGLRPGDIDVVLADAAGVPQRDGDEAAAIVALFGENGVPVTSTKPLTGRLLSGAGPLDIVTALLSMRDAVIPPIANITEPSGEHQIDLVLGTARSAPVGAALVLARGRWGFNSAVVVRAIPD